MKPIIFGVPSGTLQTKTLELFAKSGILRTPDIGRAYELKTEYDGLILRILDRRGMPQDITDGVADFGITGSDYLDESGCERLKTLGELTYSRATDKPTRFVLAGPSGKFSSPDAVKGTTIYTELPNLTRKKLAEVCGFGGEEIKVKQTYGKTETAGAFRGAAFTDITETGATLTANNMEILATLSESSPTIYARPESMRNLRICRTIEDISALLLATLAQERIPQVMVEMNVPRSALEKVCQMIPSNTSPTILPEQNNDWVVIKALMPRKALINISGDLRRIGVRGIAEIELRAVL